MSLFTLKYFNIIDCLVAIIHLNVFFRLSSISVSTRRFARHRRLPVPGRKSTCTRACMEWSLPWVECVLLFIDRTCKPSPYSNNAAIDNWSMNHFHTWYTTNFPAAGENSCLYYMGLPNYHLFVAWYRNNCHQQCSTHAISLLPHAYQFF